MRNPGPIDTANTGAMDEVHITSVLIRTMPQALPRIVADVSTMAGVEVHSQDAGGKLIITLETASLGGVTECVDQIGRLEGVINATLVYHQVETPHHLDEVIEVESLPQITVPEKVRGVP